METRDINQVKSQLKQIIASDLDANIELSTIEDEISLFDEGIGLDSISMVNLMVLIESRFKINFDDEEVSLATFKNINSLSRYVFSKINIAAEKV